jgi:hypothetical protein
VFRFGNKCWVFLHVGFCLGSRSWGAGTGLSCMYMNHCILLLCLFYLTIACTLSSYRQLRVAVQCNTYKGCSRSLRRFPSASQPTEPPKPRSRASICIRWVLACGGKVTDAAGCWHEGHQLPKNQVRDKIVCMKSQAIFLPTGTALAERAKICESGAHHVWFSRLLLPPI